MPQLAGCSQEEFITGMASGKHEVGGQGALGRAHRPDMKVMDGRNPRAGLKVSSNRLGIDLARPRVDRHRKGAPKKPPRPPHDHADDDKAGEWIDPTPTSVENAQACHHYARRHG